MENYKLFIRSMRVMGKKRFVYLGSIFVMSVTFALFGIMSSLLMKCVVDIAQTGEYERLGYSIAVIVAVGVISLLIYRVATIRYNVEAKRVYGDLSEKVLDAEMSLPYSYYEKHHSGEIVSKVSYDLTKWEISTAPDCGEWSCPFTGGGVSGADVSAKLAADDVPAGGQQRDDGNRVVIVKSHAPHQQRIVRN